MSATTTSSQVPLTVTTIQDGLIDHITLYRPIAWFQRLDVFPFLIVYLLSIFAITTDYEKLKFPFLIIFPVGLILHLLLFLLAQSSVDFRCILGKKKVKDVTQAVYVHVHAAKNAGKDRLVPLMFLPPVKGATTSVNLFGEEYGISPVIFSFQEVTYCYNIPKATFFRLNYPVKSVDGEKFAKWQGHTTQENVIAAYRRWGINEFNIPMPHFLDLYMEHLVAPFFVFQVLCLFLWSLDDYWYYSAFTLIMLMFFEGVMCNQRLNSVAMMRNMRRPPYKIFVYRCGSWSFVDSDNILPGDILSITADQTIYASDITESGLLRQRKPESNFEGKVLPCDVLLIKGNCVVNEAMLTGESIPKVKESFNSEDNDIETMKTDDITRKSIWNRHLLLGGTLIQQHSNPFEYSNNLCKIPHAPDNGCIGIAIRTGFATTQGELMRKILFATEGTSGASKDTFAFIAVLVLFALVAAGAVLQQGILDERRNKFRLALHCIMIITSVVPPELPMELSLAVTNSLAALAKQMIFCTEPFRIPFAGKLNVICFDKTGTLTKDEMVLKGVVAAQNINPLTGERITEEKDDEDDGAGTEDKGKSLHGDENHLSDEMIAPDTTTDFVQCINGSCHDLVQRTGFGGNKSGSPEILGDPLEYASFSTSGFDFVPPSSSSAGRANSSSFAANNIVNRDLNLDIQIIHKYPFNSELKRMSVVVQIRPLDPSAADSKLQYGKHYVFTKGAPEVIQPFLAKVPDNYATIYQQHMKTGKRVLVLAYKQLPAATASKSIPRQVAEKDLLFAGFLIFDSDLKADSKGVVQELISSNHQVVMITGDSIYTAANVGRRVALFPNTKKVLVLTVVEEAASGASTGTKGSKKTEPEATKTNKKALVWRRVDSADGDNKERQKEDISFDLAQLIPLVAGGQYVLSVTGSALEHLIAEYSPSVIKDICHVITIFARVSPNQKEKIILAYNESGYFSLMCGDGTNDVGALKAAYVGVSVINNPRLESKVEDAAKGGNKKGKLGASNKDRLQRALLELQEHEADPTIVKLGDASIASPFTAKRTSIDSVLTVVRQGRCTLVGTIQVYKVLALNCLSSAFMMSALYMRGLKQGDTQMTCSGLIIAALFFFVSQAKPLSHISPTRPPANVFHPAVAISIVGQFLVHLGSMYYTLRLCEGTLTEDSATITPDGKFTPNLFNSAMFLLANHMQINNFWINYRGAPYMEDISLNIYLWRSLQIIYLVILIVIGGQFEPINDFLQLVQFPNTEFQIQFLVLLAVNSIANYGIEFACRKLE